MAYRFTNTDKWNDGWFCTLNPIEKLLFIYLCDSCDIAGFIEINEDRIVVDLKCNKSQIKGAFEGLRRGLTFSKSNDCIYINNFLKHQKNLPLNQSNNAHKGIISRFELYKYKFNITDIDKFILGAKEGLTSPTGKGNGKGNGLGEEKKFDFKKELLNLGVSENLVNDWLLVRKNKKGINTETAFISIKSQIEKSGLSANDCIKIAVERSWSGFNSQWLNNMQQTNKHSANAILSNIDLQEEINRF